MKKIAILPLRKGSKSIINKNKKKLLGRPLFSWTLSEAIFSKLDEVYVYTDDEEIIDYINHEYSWTSKIKARKRSEESATDTASTEFAMIEFSKSIDHDYDIFCLLQATSPLTTRNDIDNVLDKLIVDGYDSALTVVNTKRFFWDENGNSINYDYRNRPRRQDFAGQFIENGAVYATTKTQFMESGIRIGGEIAIVEMPEDTLMEIDEPHDWTIIEACIENRLKDKKTLNAKIKALVLDVDGVFTNGNVVVSQDGEFSKEFSVIDGMGLALLRESGVKVIIMTSEDSPMIQKRMDKLKLDQVYLGVKDKYSRLTNVLAEQGLDRNEILYAGDDINDLANILSVGWGVCPQDANLLIKTKADLVLANSGGNKVIREIVEFILKYNSRQ